MTSTPTILPYKNPHPWALKIFITYIKKITIVNVLG